MNVVILQNTGKPTAPAIIRLIIAKQKIKVNLNLLRRRGSSSKKVMFSTSLEVAPHDMSISNMCERSACETCKEMPPRKMVRRRIHFAFSKTRDRISLPPAVVWKGKMKQLEGGENGVTYAMAIRPSQKFDTAALQVRRYPDP